MSSSYCRCNAISTGGSKNAKSNDRRRICDFTGGNAFVCCRRSQDEDHKFCFSRRRKHSIKIYVGSDTSPPLQIADLPSEAKSLVLIVDDPDVPGGLFTHWTVWNIPPQTSAVGEGSPPKGVQRTNDFGKIGLRWSLSALGDASLLLQGFRARLRAGFTIRRKTLTTGCCDERAYRRSRRANGALLAQEVARASGFRSHADRKRDACATSDPFE